MKQRRHYSSNRLSRDAERLVWLAKGLAESGSRAEDGWWEEELATLIGKMLGAGQEDALNQALDRLHETNGRAYDDLADLIEAASESPRSEGRRCLLLAMPVLAWSRYRIPDRKLPAGLLANLRVQLKAHILADEVRVGMADLLFSPDQMPRGFVATQRLAAELADQAGREGNLAIALDGLPETGHYIADVRYILAVVGSPAGRPLFRWQETDGSRDAALREWQAQAGPSVQASMPGCAIQLLLPDAYFSAWRQADQAARGYSLVGTAAYLQAALDLPATGLRAIAAPYYDHRLVEWRVGFARRGDDQILHGVVWPLLGGEDENTDVAAEIEQTLKQAGLTDIVMLDQRMALEYCEDCGAPLFPNADADSVHAEMPEEAEEQGAPLHLH
ncbi:DUF2863 family protein [Parasulfuritortus cantonensis]|uniref:DUF2863 family protein n=1 Tax=Parasulfuritortus cantonensis TaxID=2528202 RepID=A0A4R1BLC5_9PROT|nr:DUF2863 family protein [Parasulfuritortus cantonensis]TCJ18146.1 DUF2863 family protein [Parasulfuritortus cantonensis]